MCVYIYIYLFIYLYLCVIEVQFGLQCVHMWTSKMIAKKTVNKLCKIIVRYSR
jgi:hypothetical protein